MGFLDRARGVAGQPVANPLQYIQQTAAPSYQGTLQQQIAQALDPRSGGGAWEKGADWVYGDIAQRLQQAGVNDLSQVKFSPQTGQLSVGFDPEMGKRFVDEFDPTFYNPALFDGHDPNAGPTPGQYKRRYLTDADIASIQRGEDGGEYLNGIIGKQLDRGLPESQTSGGFLANAERGGYNRGNGIGTTWEGEGGTNYQFIENPDGSVGIVSKGMRSNETQDVLTALAVVGGGMLAGGALGAATAGGAAGGAAGAAGSAGAVGSGAGFVGEGALSGIGAWDAALASAPSWTAGAGAAGAAGAAGSGGGGATTAGGFVGEGAASGVPAWDGAVGSGVAGSGGTAAAGAGAGGSGGGGAVTGTPPPANPYNVGSYFNGTNLSNLASSGMSGFNWTDLIGPGLQLVNGYMGAQAAGNAADAQLQAAREAAARFEPWRQAGAWAIGQGANMLGKSGPEAAKAAFMQDPGYQWRLEQGEKALTRNASARGLMGSGKFLKDAMRFNQGEASQEFGNSFNRLQALAGMGQTATQSSSDYLTQGANAQAAGIVGKANAYNNALGQGYSMYQNNRLMNGLGY